MRIITRGVIDWATLAVEEEDAYEYSGAIAHAKSSGSAPQATDPYEAAGAQYGLSTGTANYNAGLNRVNQQNPLGGTYWSQNSSGVPQTAQPSMGGSGLPTQPGQAPIQTGSGTYAPSSGATASPTSGASLPPSNIQQQTGSTTSGLTAPGYGQLAASQGLSSQGLNSSGDPYASQLASMEQQQPPSYTQTTQLAPQFESQLQQPLDTSGIAGMPGGPSTTQDLQNTTNALYNQQEAYIQPEQQIQQEQLQSQLANEGVTPGSAAYGTEMDRLNRSDTFANSQAMNSAITGGGAEQSRLFDMGSQSLQNQISARQAPISEYNSLLPGGGGGASAQTPDISGAFTNQLNSQLAGYNANTASSNADTSAAGSLIGSYLMYLALA